MTHIKIIASIILFLSVSLANGSDPTMQKHLQDHLKLLTRMFVRIDRNTDNFLDKSELLEVASEMETLHLEDNIEQEFDSLDHDLDNQVSVEESVYNYFDKNVTEKDIERIEEGTFSKSETEFWIKRNIKKFREADQDKDGFLSKSELKYYLHPEAYVEMKQLLVQETLEDHDKNGNGAIEADEFNARGHTGLFDQSVRAPNSEELMDIFTGPLDKDGDGSLNREEIWKWISMEETRYHEEEVDHILSEADDNRDSRISFEEVKNHDYKLMDSPVTGYGRLFRDHDEL